jgi:hypothetical protein
MPPDQHIRGRRYESAGHRFPIGNRAGQGHAAARHQPVCMGVAVLKYRVYELNRGHKPGGLLHADHGPAGRRVRRANPADYQGATGQRPGGRGRRHAGHRGAVQPAAAAGAAGGRPPVQPGPLRCRGNRGAFSARLRRTIDLDTIRGDLVGVVHEAFQPGRVSVWLPGTGPHTTAPVPARPGTGQPDSSMSHRYRPTVTVPSGSRRGGWPSRDPYPKRAPR